MHQITNIDKLNVKELKLLIAEKVHLKFSVSPVDSGFVLCIATPMNKHVLSSQRSDVRVFKTLDALFSFLINLDISNFEVNTHNE